MSPPTRLDPDALAALEEERTFLLRSLDDLDAEFAAGDIDEADYEGLKDDYTRRAAEVIRSIDARQAAFRRAPGVRWRQVLVWLVGLAILGGLSGALIARSSGARSGNDTITGGVRQSEITRLNEAQTLFSDPERWDDAIAIYDSVIDDNPSSTEALTYRAWLRYRIGAPGDEVLADLEEVARLDSSYPDGAVFRTVVLADAGRYQEAADVLSGIDLADASPIIQIVLADQGLVGRVQGELALERLAALGPEPTLDQVGLSPDDALAAASYLLDEGSADGAGVVAALKLYRAVRVDDPANAAALSREAWLLFQSGLADTARELADQAVEAAPDDPEARLTRASVLVDTDPAAACADLAELASLVQTGAVDPAFGEQAAQLSAAFC